MTTQTTASSTTHSLQWTDVRVSEEELEADKAIPYQCAPLHEVGWDLDLILSSGYADFQLYLIQHAILYLQYLPDFHIPHKMPSNISTLTGFLVFSPGLLLPLSSPCTLASL